VEAAARRILESEKGILLLVNNAKYFGTKNYLEMSPEEMQRVMNINLLCPLILARTFAEGLINLQGYIIQLGPLHVESSHGGPAGAASSGGLKWMSELLFHDLREFGVKVCHLSPEPNRGRDPRTTPRKGTRVTASIDPEAVAQAVEQLLQSPYGNIVTELVIRPLRVREPEFDPVVKLPYPNPKPVPYTVPREMIEAEDQLEEEEFQKKQDLKRQRRKESTRKRAQKAANLKKEEQPAEKLESQPDKPGETSEAPKKRRRRSRSRQEKPQPAKQESKKEEPPEPKPESDTTKSDTSRASQEPRKRSRRKPKPPRVEVGFLKEKKEETVVEKKPEPEKADPPVVADVPEKAEKPAKKKIAAKKTARKAAAKKAAARKSPAKKAARKAAAKKSARKTPNKSASARKTPRKRVPKKKTTEGKSD
jgi:hypothetical protein